MAKGNWLVRLESVDSCISAKPYSHTACWPFWCLQACADNSACSSMHVGALHVCYGHACSDAVWTLHYVCFHLLHTVVEQIAFASAYTYVQQRLHGHMFTCSTTARQVIVLHSHRLFGCNVSSKALGNPYLSTLPMLLRCCCSGEVIAEVLSLAEDPDNRGDILQAIEDKFQCQAVGGALCMP